jgi:methionyl-tRNA formyltransferase
VRVGFAGSPAAAVAPLRALAASRHEVPIVVTRVDKARGRSGRPSPTPVAVAAEELGIEVLRPESINRPETLERLDAAHLDALAVAAFGQILREGVLSRWPCINVHFSLLPAYRGAAPVERALMDGVEETGVTIMRMDEGLDTGPTLQAESVRVGEDEDAGALTARLSEMGGRMLVEVLDRLEAGTLVETPQPEGFSLAPKIVPEDRILDFSRPAAELARRIRALSPHVGATCTIDGQPFKIWRARALPEASPPGLARDGDRLRAGTGEGTLEILELQPPGKGRMAADAFLRGRRGPLALGAA